MGIGKEVSSMGGTASTLLDLESWWRTEVLDREVVANEVSACQW